MELETKGKRAKEASIFLMNADTNKKNTILATIANQLIIDTDKLIEANSLDLSIAKSTNLDASFIDRLTLSEQRIKDISEAVKELIQLDDPINEILDEFIRPNNIHIQKISVPIGVIGIIYEARPNVTIDAAALCLKSGNATMLRGSKDAINSNKAIVETIKEALRICKAPEGCVELIEDTSREVANAFMKLNEYLNVIIPRGGAGLIAATVKNATVPVIETGSGNVHVYFDKDANYEMAMKILLNSKTSRTSVCNAAETLVIHKYFANLYLKDIIEELKKHNVLIHIDKEYAKISEQLLVATSEDYDKEYSSLEICIHVVENTCEAIAFINAHSTSHSETIVTENQNTADKFLTEIDSACVYHNVSTRFSDGFEFGFGAEIGISTQKIHARGPMGLKELTSYKYIVRGNGQIR